MTSDQHSRIQAARAELDAVRREISTGASESTANVPETAKQGKANQKALDDAIKALDTVKVSEG